ncbi:MAG: dihydrofolate reductase [Akkermansia sp.]|nr:dihydrofolate reductase [Akkermansia sp.]
MDAERGIGLNNGIPWHLPEDLRNFKRLTMGHPILMGRRTWESLGRPLPGRQNIVLSRSGISVPPGVVLLRHAADLAKTELMHEEVMVIGGAQIYAALLPELERLYVSRVPGVHGADTFFPPFEHLFPRCTRVGQWDSFELFVYEH